MAHIVEAEKAMSYNVVMVCTMCVNHVLLRTDESLCHGHGRAGQNGKNDRSWQIIIHQDQCHGGGPKHTNTFFCPFCQKTR
jgi:hypothetical protein